MTPEYVLAYVPKKMRDLGVNENYSLVYREIVLKNKETITIDAKNQFYYFIEGYATDFLVTPASTQFTITSEGGLYDLLATNINEVAHEHTGTITIVNRSTVLLHLIFIVVIPNN